MRAAWRPLSDPLTSLVAIPSMSPPTKPLAPPSLTNATLVYQPQSKVPQLSAQMDEGIDVMWLMNEAQSRRIVSGIHGREAV